MPKITPVDYRILIRVFERDGFVVSRRKGDHILMTKPGVHRPLVIKSSPQQVPVIHIRTNLTTAGISRDRYFALLEQVRYVENVQASPKSSSSSTSWMASETSLRAPR